MSFSKDLADFTKKAEKAGEMVFRGSALEVLSSIIKRTPVDTGRLRGNWFTTLSNASDTVSSSRTASKAISDAAAKTRKAKLSDVIYMINNLPYAAAVEYGLFSQGPNKTNKTKGGYSSQAVGGMVRVTISEWNRLVNRKAKQV